MFSKKGCARPFPMLSLTIDKVAVSPGMDDSEVPENGELQIEQKPVYSESR